VKGDRGEKLSAFPVTAAGRCEHSCRHITIAEGHLAATSGGLFGGGGGSPEGKGIEEDGEKGDWGGMYQIRPVRTIHRHKNLLVEKM